MVRVSAAAVAVLVYRQRGFGFGGGNAGGRSPPAPTGASSPPPCKRLGFRVWGHGRPPIRALFACTAVAAAAAEFSGGPQGEAATSRRCTTGRSGP